jgi:L-threonylcarbamoyladenylate synthase
MSVPVRTGEAAIAEGARLLAGGRLVAFPTETVYGLGADAGNDRAVASIFAAKGRPSFNPLIVHVANIADAEAIAVFDARAAELATAFWPGPLTLVLERRKGARISPLVSAGLPSIALRIPDHAVALELIRRAGVPIAAPSANRSGQLSPTTPQHVAQSLGDEVAMILAAGRCGVGVESTVVDLTGDTPTLLRPGGLSREAIEVVLGETLAVAHGNGPVKSPGMMEKHYAPRAALRMGVTDDATGEAYLAFGPDSFSGRGAARRLNLSEAGDLTEAAANLFSMLHELDDAGFETIAVAPVPETGLGLAINDRLRRAAIR